MLLRFGELCERFGDVAALRIALMKQHSVAQVQLLARRQRVAAFGGAGSGRWGDYTAAAVVDEDNIWFATEYIPGGVRTVLAISAASSTRGR